jgi:hypothetical protein
MEALGIWIVAQTRAESAAAAIGLAMLSSCFLLAVYRPRRTELEGTPHRVSNIALMLAMGWLVLMAGAAFSDTPRPEKELLSPVEIWTECAVQLAVITIIGSAYVFSRRPDPGIPIAESQPATGDDNDDSRRSSPAGRPFLSEDWAHHLGVGITVGLASLVPTMFLGQILAPARETKDTHILLRTLEGQGWEYLFPIVLAAAVLAPVAEELLFRVVFQGWFADRVGKLAVPLTAGLFCLVHGPSDAPLLVPLALALGLLFEYRRSYLEVVAAHAAFNAANLFAAVNAY